MWVCGRGGFVNAGPENGEMSFGHGCGLGVVAAACMFFVSFTKIVAVCVLFVVIFCVRYATRMFFLSV